MPIPANRKTFERSDGKVKGLTTREVVAKLKNDVGIDVVRSKIHLHIERKADDPFQLEILQIDTDLTPTQEAAIITAFPELRKR